MVGQRQYWVVSPNVDGGGKKVEEWKREILLRHAAILLWGPENTGNGGMGPRFADKVRLGDIVLIARGKNRADMVGFGVVKGQLVRKRLPPWDQVVSLRGLDPFKQCDRVPENVPLLKVVQHTRAFVQKHPEANPEAKRLFEWIEQQLKLEDQEIGSNETTSSTDKQRPTGVKVTDLPESGDYGYKFKTKAAVKRARKVEAELLSEYEQWLGKQGRRLKALKYNNRIECDGWEEERRNLIEAKGLISREDIRMAVGQLLDYAFQGKGRYRRPSRAILLREYPGDDRINWLEPLGIKVIWREKGSFVDNANGQFV